MRWMYLTILFVTISSPVRIAVVRRVVFRDKKKGLYKIRDEPREEMKTLPGVVVPRPKPATATRGFG